MIGNGGLYGAPGPGFFTVEKFGRNPDVDSDSTPEDIHPDGGLYPFYPVSLPLEVVSSSLNDTLLGSGARTVQFEILDTNWDKTIQTIELDGQTPVNIPTISGIRGNRGSVITAGVTGSNEGSIIVRPQGGGDTLLSIPLSPFGGSGQTLQAIYSLPRGFKGKIIRHWARLDKFPGADAQLRIVVREFGGAWQTKETFPISETKSHDVPANIKILEKSDVRIEVFDVTANDITIDAGFDIEAENL